MIRFLLGVLATLLALALVSFVVVWFGLVPAGADAAYFPLEKWAAKKSLNTAIAREEPGPPYPGSPPTTAMIVAGAKLYQQNCAVCHGSGGSSESDIARGMYIAPPQFPKHGVADDPAGVTYWKIEHGIRFSAMPAFGKVLTQQQIWNIAYFLGIPADKLTGEAKAIWDQPHGD